jgi:hypothetical protein
MAPSSNSFDVCPSQKTTKAAMPSTAPMTASGGHQPDAAGASPIARAHAMISTPARTCITSTSVASGAPVTWLPSSHDRSLPVLDRSGQRRADTDVDEGVTEEHDANARRIQVLMGSSRVAGLGNLVVPARSFFAVPGPASG